MLALRSALLSQRCLGRSSSKCRHTRPLLRSLNARPVFAVTRAFSACRPVQHDQNEPEKPAKLANTLRENIYTVPNLLTVSRILACPVLGYAIVQDNFVVATSLLVYAGLTDLVCLICFLLSTKGCVLSMLPLFRVPRLTAGSQENTI